MPSVRTLLLYLASVCGLLACAPAMAVRLAGVPVQDTVSTDAAPLVSSLDDGLAAHSTAAERTAIRSADTRFSMLLREGSTPCEGETPRLDFAAAGLSSSRSGKPLDTIADERFARTLLRVWLGEPPADADRKHTLLGL